MKFKLKNEKTIPILYDKAFVWIFGRTMVRIEKVVRNDRIP